MKERRHTLLQQAVIRKLRIAGLDELANLAREAWSRGEQAPSSYRAVDSGTDEQVPTELRADFDRANEQSLESEEET